MTKLEAALDAARRGFSVFPLVPNAKTPALKNWQNLATTDKTQLEAWWAQWPEANIGITTERLLVVDIDPRNGGKVSMVMLYMTEPELPHTLISDTQGGGHHVIFNLPEHTAVNCGKNVLGSGIDIKSSGGYIVAPGSTVEGRPYKWAADRPLATAPQWLLDLCRRPRSRSASAGKRVVDSDDVGMALAVKWIETADGAAEGARDNAAFAVAARLYDFGLTKAEVGDLVALWNDTRCDPPLEPSDLARIAESAGRNRDKAIGSAHPLAPGFDAVEIAPPAEIKAPIPRTPEPRKGLHYLTFADAAGRALTHNADPLVEGILDCGTMSIVYGESNVGKSFLDMDQGFHIAAALPWAERSVKQGGVMWVAAEGGSGVYKRLAALKKHYERDDVPFFIVPCPVNLLNPKADIAPLIALIKQAEQDSGQKIVKVSLDTLSRVIAGGDENSSVDMGQLVHHFDAIREHTGAHLSVIHHTGKDKARGARGHSLLRAATDTEIEVADRFMTVTKQRDMEGDVSLRFDLRAIPIGIDQRGKTVTSCYVEVRQKTTIPDEAGILTNETALFADMLVIGLLEKCDKNPKTIEGQRFTTAFAISCAPQVETGDARNRDVQSKAMRNHVSRMMLEMLNNGWLGKDKRGQWFMRHAHDAHDAQN